MSKADNAPIEVRAELEHKQLHDCATSNFHRVIEIRVERDKDRLKEGKRKLENMIADFLKEEEGISESIGR